MRIIKSKYFKHKKEPYCNVSPIKQTQPKNDQFNERTVGFSQN